MVGRDRSALGALTLYGFSGFIVVHVFWICPLRGLELSLSGFDAIPVLKGSRMGCETSIAPFSSVCRGVEISPV